MRAAVDAVPDFHSMSKDPAPAVSTQRGQSLDRTLETVERSSLGALGDRERLVVVVPAGITGSHQGFLP